MTIPVPTTDCIEEKPPQLPGALFDECDGWEACLTMDNAGRLVQYLNKAHMYMNDWYVACGKKEQ